MSRTDLIPPDRSPSAHCHARRVRLPDGVGATWLAGLFERAVRTWWGDTPDRLPRLWDERVPAACDSAVAGRRVEAELHRPLDAEGALLRAVLLQYADGPADLVLVAHRANLDALSLRTVADVLTGRARYEGFTDKTASHIVAAADAETLKRWREADFSGRIAWASGDDAAGDRTGLVTVAIREAGPDVPATMAAAVGLVLGRYENQENPVVGVLGPVPERPEGALGAFDAGLLLALDLSGARTAGELVAETAQALASDGGRCDGRQYAELLAETGGRVVAGLLTDGPAESGSGTHVPCQTAPFPLTIVPGRTPDGGLQLVVRHRLEDVDADSARRFARHVVRAYEQLANAPAGLVPADVELMDEAETRQVVALGRPLRRLDWRPERIDDVFASRVAERPDAVALTCEGRSLTYAELDARADRFAAALLDRGVRAGERVGVCLGRTPDLVVAMLAVLKADAVYVPMDPAYPADRLAFTAQDAALRIVIADQDFPGGGSASVVRPEELETHGGEAGRARPERREPGEAAYVIYTSGSTGRPKGVVVPHRNVVALLSATRDDFGLGPGDTWTLFHSSAFDFSVWEIWGALLTGARLVVVPYWVSRSPEEFRELLARERVTVLNQTPSAFAQLMEADRRQDERLAVRLVIFGGEPLDARPLRAWFDRYPEDRCRLVNMYGITETTVHVTAQNVTRREAMTGSRSVGHALPGWHLYVLDERGRPVPCGVPGEIHVGGDGVALEYLDRPELTAQRFLPDPFTMGRVYRSGDRGRLLPDGRLEHLGRLDTQVKLRGFRVELDEIRNVLLDDPSVTAAAVVLNGDRDAAGARIDAYVVPAGGDPAAIRQRAAKVLPEHMLPATITPLDTLPLTANGKLDVRGLPEPVVAPAAPIRAPSGELAGALAAVWESVLGVPVGPDDNFFELGGNSLYAMRVAAAMRDRGLPAFPMRELYLHPTVSGLAYVLDEVTSHE